MSGSSITYTGGIPVQRDCASLFIKTKLASPINSVIKKISVGDTLKVILTPPAGPISLVTKDKETAGSILPMDLDLLIQCILDGHEFTAKVSQINNGNCDILITHI